MKRSNLKRTSTLKRKKPFKKFIAFGEDLESGITYKPRPTLKHSRKPLRKLRPAKLKSRTAFRKAVMRKNGGKCLRCTILIANAVMKVVFDAEKLTEPMFWRKADHPHHWLPISRGGTDDPENGIPLDHNCHRWIHDNPKQAHLDGWLLKSGEPMNENAKRIKEWMEWKES